MAEIHGIGAFGIVPYLSEDLLKQVQTRAGKIAYLATLGDKAKKPRIKEGVHAARGALKWIAEILKEEEKEK